jgi:hypothetical protein
VFEPVKRLPGPPGNPAVIRAKTTRAEIFPPVFDGSSVRNYRWST